MKRLIFLTLSMGVLLSACNTDEQEVSNDEITSDIETVETRDEKETDVINNLPDFTMDLPTFIEKYNTVSEGGDGFTPIEKDFDEIKFAEESGGYSKNLINVDTESSYYSLTAMFDEGKNFKRLSYLEIIRDEGESDLDAINTLMAVFYTLDIEADTITDTIGEFFINVNDKMETSTDKYVITSTNIGTEYKVVVFDSKE